MEILAGPFAGKKFFLPADGKYRILSGRQMLAEYPQLFSPSFGIVVSNSPATP